HGARMDSGGALTEKARDLLRQRLAAPRCRQHEGSLDAEASALVLDPGHRATPEQHARRKGLVDEGFHLYALGEDEVRRLTGFAPSMKLFFFAISAARKSRSARTRADWRRSRCVSSQRSAASSGSGEARRIRLGRASATKQGRWPIPIPASTASARPSTALTR